MSCPLTVHRQLFSAALILKKKRRRQRAMPKCFFRTCCHPAEPSSDKCADHKSRTRCHALGCTNQCYARQRCIRHGGKKRCRAAGCHRNSRSNGRCYHHRKKCRAAPYCFYDAAGDNRLCAFHEAIPPEESSAPMIQGDFNILLDLVNDGDQEEKRSTDDGISPTSCDVHTSSHGASYLVSCDTVMSGV
ncbi:unnamed protein product [Aphanomyces euteiches]